MPTDNTEAAAVVWETWTDTTSDPPTHYRVCRDNGRDLLKMRFDNDNDRFMIRAMTGKRVMSVDLIRELRRHLFDHNEDGHGGVYAMISGPEERRHELELILKSSFVKPVQLLVCGAQVRVHMEGTVVA